MIKFKRYDHINDLIAHYCEQNANPELTRILAKGVNNEADAITFSHFIWQMVDNIHEDEEAGRVVLGRTDNTDMLPDLSYEITKYMRKAGFYAVWERISNLDA